MKLNYEVEWELKDEVIEQIVDDVEKEIKEFPDSFIDNYIDDIVEDDLVELDESDHDNIELYIDKVIAEVKKRYFDRKNKNISLPTIPTKELHSGWIQGIDDMGKIYIPLGLRNIIKVENGDLFEIFFDNEKNIILKKYYK